MNSTEIKAPGSIPHVPSLLKRLLEPINDDTVHGFFFTDDPIQLPYLTSPALHLKVIQGDSLFAAFRSSTDTQPFNVVHVSNFFYPVLSIRNFVLGFGAAYFDGGDDVGTPQNWPSQSLHNVRFCLDSATRTLTFLYDDGNVLTLLQVNLIDNQLDPQNQCNSSHNEYIAVFKRDALQILATTNSSSCVSLLMPYILFFSCNYVSLNSTASSSESTTKDTHYSTSSSEQYSVKKSLIKPKHPFDNTTFIELMRKSLGAFNGQSTRVSFNDSFPVCTDNVILHSNIRSVRDIPLLIKMRDECLQNHARSIIESPLQDASLFQLSCTSTPLPPPPQPFRDVWSNNTGRMTSETLQDILAFPTTNTPIPVETEQRSRIVDSSELFQSQILPLISDEAFSFSPEKLDSDLPNPINYLSNIHHSTCKDILNIEGVGPNIEVERQTHHQEIPLISKSDNTHDQLVKRALGESDRIEDILRLNDTSQGEQEKNKLRNDQDNRMLIRQELLRQRRERNRASAMRSNERAKKKRENLIESIRLAKEKLASLRIQEIKLRTENLELRRLIDVNK